jgi:protein-S-isoprenylcysteine O-methyltransferase Ste14
MEKALSRWGVGPMMFLSVVAYGVVAGAATHAWPDACLLRSPPYAVFATVGGILLVVGVPMWLTAAISVMRAYNRDQLVTSGVFAVVRHPLYAAVIVLDLPGLALLTRSWPLLLTPLVAYAVFKLLIHREDEYLERRFGQAYLDYRARVNEVIPLPRFWSRRKRK